MPRPSPSSIDCHASSSTSSRLSYALRPLVRRATIAAATRKRDPAPPRMKSPVALVGARRRGTRRHPQRRRLGHDRSTGRTAADTPPKHQPRMSMPPPSAR